MIECHKRDGAALVKFNITYDFLKVLFKFKMSTKYYSACIYHGWKKSLCKTTEKI
jgi:hypothetical protein